MKHPKGNQVLLPIAAESSSEATLLEVQFLPMKRKNPMSSNKRERPFIAKKSLL
jgi:hypothetical protein